jgi:heme-degrading monooxygenase HmoA
MFAVVFEVQPKQECWQTYLDLAQHLKPLLEQIDGFIDNERFASCRTPGRVLSLSTWRDETALVRWRTQGEHHQVQERGRFAVFADYHLRVGEIDSERTDVTEVGRAKELTITELMAPTDGESTRIPDVGLDNDLASQRAGLVDYEMFTSIYTPGKVLVLAAWLDARAARAFVPSCRSPLRQLRHRRITVIRDYGMRDRHEAPQFYAPVR